ncbi:MAG: ABC transporter permease [Planctomycetes bacterium]|nr:ABC transporter permease [Planctomycetota bacterium]
MDKIFTVAVREFIETVKTKAFLISTVFMPILLVVAIAGTGWVGQLAEEKSVPPRRVALVDQSGMVATEFMKEVLKNNEEDPTKQFKVTAVPPEAADEEDLAEDVRGGALYAYLLIPPNVIDESAPCSLGRKDSQFEPGRRLQTMLNEAVRAVRFAQAGIDRRAVDDLMASVPIRTIDVQTGEEASGGEAARLLTPFGFMLLLFMGIFGISQGLLTSVIEEKSSRVVEVLLSAVSPTQLMAGKIVGMAAVGAVLLGVWGTVGYFGAQSQGVSYLVTGYRLLHVALYFVPGFLLIASILAGVGSACNTLKEAQSMIFPLSLVTFIPMIFWFQISQNPASLFSIVLSYIPPITPFVMVLRICVDPETPLWQVISTLVVLWLAVLAAIWAAGRVFRVGVLMYGKPPSLRELLRWLRYS